MDKQYRGCGVVFFYLCLIFNFVQFVMSKRLVLAIILTGVFVWSGAVQAGFGISPPYVKPKKAIFPGSHYEQKITLLRSEADSPMTAIITVTAPEMGDWVTIDKGFEFEMPAGELQVPMVVKVDVPAKAEIGNYKGNFNIRIVPKGSSKNPGVAIALGARVDMDIDVTNERFFDFAVRMTTIPNIGVLSQPWNWRIFSYFFYRIAVVLKIENIGNVAAGPTKVHLDVYDVEDKKLLESYDDSKIDKVDPFVTSDVIATYPTKLGKGYYWGRVTVYNGSDIVHKDKITFEIKDSGKLTGYKHWLMLGGLVSLVLLFALSLVKVRVWKYIFLILYVLSWPLRILLGLLLGMKNKVVESFWDKMGQKAERYKSNTKKRR